MSTTQDNASLKVLVTGASGYIGGSVLTTLLKSTKDAIKNLTISALVRGEAQINKIKELGVNPIEIRDLDDNETIQKAASEHDVVIHMASGFHSGSAEALIPGLAERKKTTRTEVHYIHTSGAGNLADSPILSNFVEHREFSDNDDIYTYEKERQAILPYPQRTTELLAIDTAVENDVKIYLISPPTIYGIGSGPFNKHSAQIPGLIKASLGARKPYLIGDGSGVWDYVHISDLVTLYELLLEKVISGANIPSGKNGYYFTSTGRGSWLEMSKLIGKAGVNLGVLDEAEPKEITLDEAEKMLGYPKLVLEVGFASNSRTRADHAKELGWKPKKTAKDYEESFALEFRALTQSA